MIGAGWKFARRGRVADAERFLRSAGPGVVTGAADDDPSGIATYALVGATQGLGLLWLALLTTPLLIGIQETCARIALATHGGLGAALSRTIVRPVLVAMIAAVVVANTFNVAADVAGMSEAANLVVPVSPELLSIAFGATLLGIEVFASYKAFLSTVKWLCLTLLAYVACAFVAGIRWDHALRATILPEIRATREYFFAAAAFLGTTVTPYLLFWQAALEVEDDARLRRDALPAAARLRLARTDVTSGMIFSNVVTWFVVALAATTVHDRHLTIASLRDMAQLLRPLAGDGATVLFVVGIAGAGLVAIPAIAGSSAYALAEIFRYRASLGETPKAAAAFYGVIAAGIAFGVLAELLHFDVVWMLFTSSVINAIVSVPLLIAVLIASNDVRLMGDLRNGWPANASLAVTTVLIAVSLFAFFLPS